MVYVDSRLIVFVLVLVAVEVATLLFALSTIGLRDLEAPTEGSRSAPEYKGARTPRVVGLCRLEEAKMLKLT